MGLAGFYHDLMLWSYPAQRGTWLPWTKASLQQLNLKGPFISAAFFFTRPQPSLMEADSALFEGQQAEPADSRKGGPGRAAGSGQGGGGRNSRCRCPCQKSEVPSSCAKADWVARKTQRTVRLPLGGIIRKLEVSEHKICTWFNGWPALPYSREIIVRTLSQQFWDLWYEVSLQLLIYLLI